MAPQTEQWTILRLLEWTTDYFKRHGADSPRLDAEVLLAEALRCQRIELYTRFGEEPSEESRTAFREMVRRRAEGTPVAYLVGHKEFYSLDLRVSEATLIPRPETEHVVIEVLDRAKEMVAEDGSRELRIADVGTGSGAIAAAVAVHLPRARLVATEISPEALRIARFNFDRHGVADRVEAFEGDLLEPLPAEPSLDIIASNPPYVSESEYAELDAGVREYEPHRALVAGPKGTEVIERLVAQAADRLRPGGRLVMELGPATADSVLGMLEAHPAYDDAKILKDLARLPRVATARRG